MQCGWMMFCFFSSASESCWTRRASAVALALCWLFVAWAFLLQRYAPINWAADAFAGNGDDLFV